MLWHDYRRDDCPVCPTIPLSGSSLTSPAAVRVWVGRATRGWWTVTCECEASGEGRGRAGREVEGRGGVVVRCMDLWGSVRCSPPPETVDDRRRVLPSVDSPLQQVTLVPVVRHVWALPTGFSSSQSAVSHCVRCLHETRYLADRVQCMLVRKMYKVNCLLLDCFLVRTKQ